MNRKSLTGPFVVPAAERVRPVAVIGGSGFIGANVADSLLSDGLEVVVIDNLSRPGVERNLSWLRDRHGSRLGFRKCDVRSADNLRRILADAGAILHFAAQTAVTTSLVNPLEDFEINAIGTINVLEAARANGRPTPVIFASTNKVYGNLGDISLIELDDRYVPREPGLRAHGVDETRRLDLCTPYGCSKGSADQYVLDYARSYGLPTAVLRMSCVYGPRQLGTEDQGWVAHFLLSALAGSPITIYGDGKQVRDVLYVSDAVAAYRGILANIDTLKGSAFNLGGGPRNAVSLRVLLGEIARLIGSETRITLSGWRKGDQPYFVADTRKLENAIGWTPRISWRDGLSHLARWLVEHRLGGSNSVNRQLEA